MKTHNNTSSFSLIKKGTKLYSILRFKCPRCQDGDLFKVNNPYRLKYLDKMPHYFDKYGEDLHDL